ncbi:MAG: hypothetical protein MOB07_28750 [Acidobacteria bacterium]|nr:hypothetical protein [Acidobacteriota bacterium]
MKQEETLWPFGTRGALLAAVIIWLVLALIFVATRAYLGWPTNDSLKLAALIVISLGLIPLALRLIDFAASRRAVVDIKGFKIDFSRVDLDQPEVRRETAGIPDNIGVSGPIFSDASPMNIIQTLKEATKNEIVVIDLKDGDAWWVTRLLALAAGAVRAGSPNTFVFIGMNENRSHQFLGWAESKRVLDSILRANPEYDRRYLRAMQISQQVFMYGNREFMPQQPPTFEPNVDVERYLNEEYTSLGSAVTEQILMDQLATKLLTPLLETPPDRLTLGRLNDLFGHCLNPTSIDLNWSKDAQIAKLLESVTPYVALVKEGRYHSIIGKADGERVLLRELFAQFHDRRQAKSTVTSTIPE